MSFRVRLFCILWLAGLSGALSMTLIDVSEIMAIVPALSGTVMPLSPLWLKVVSVLQPAVLLALAIFGGVRLAAQVGLSAPVAEALAAGRNAWTAMKPQILPGVIGGVAGGGAVVVSWVVWRPFLAPEFVVRAEKLGNVMPFATRLLYGGIAEELLLRFGLMTVLVWATWRVFQKGQGRPRDYHFGFAIVASAILFGIGHLPMAAALATALTFPMVSYVVVANSTFGIIAGYLYWKRGLESAMLAHMLAHVVIVSASPLGK